MNIKQRKDLPGLNKNRADIIVGGLMPLKALIDIVEPDGFVVSGNGLRDGVFFEHYLKAVNNEGDILWDVLEHSIGNIMKNMEVNVEHARHVENLSIKLFEQLKPLHGLGLYERELLKIAALLHDIGTHIDYDDHQKHSFYLMLNTKIYGMDHKTLILSAFLASMHRVERECKEDIKSFQPIISDKDIGNINKLKVFLMIAEKLDRNEYGSVEDIMVSITEDTIFINVKSAANIDLEIAAAMKSREVFKKEFGRELIINDFRSI